MDITTTISALRTTSTVAEVKAYSKVTAQHAPQEVVSISAAAQEASKIDAWVDALKQMDFPQPLPAQGNPQEIITQKILEELFFI